MMSIFENWWETLPTATQLLEEKVKNNPGAEADLLRGIWLPVVARMEGNQRIWEAEAQYDLMSEHELRKEQDADEYVASVEEYVRGVEERIHRFPDEPTLPPDEPITPDEPTKILVTVTPLSGESPEQATERVNSVLREALRKRPQTDSPELAAGREAKRNLYMPDQSGVEGPFRRRRPQLQRRSTTPDDDRDWQSLGEMQTPETEGVQMALPNFSARELRLLRQDASRHALTGEIAVYRVREDKIIGYKHSMANPRVSHQTKLMKLMQCMGNLAFALEYEKPHRIRENLVPAIKHLVAWVESVDEDMYLARQTAVKESSGSEKEVE